MRGTYSLAKKYFLSTIQDSTKFHYFCKVRACQISVKKSIFHKLPQIMEKHIVLMRGTCRLAKNFFLSTIQDSTKFHYFCKVRACRISVKKSIFQKLPKIVKKHFF